MLSLLRALRARRASPEVRRPSRPNRSHTMKRALSVAVVWSIAALCGTDVVFATSDRVDAVVSCVPAAPTFYGVDQPHLYIEFRNVSKELWYGELPWRDEVIVFPWSWFKVFKE